MSTRGLLTIESPFRSERFSSYSKVPQSRLADLALSARRPRETGFQKKQGPGGRFEELFFTLSRDSFVAVSFSSQFAYKVTFVPSATAESRVTMDRSK